VVYRCKGCKGATTSIIITVGVCQILKKSTTRTCFKIMYEVDDVVFKEVIPDYNKFKFAFDTEEIRQNCIDIINLVDEVTVTCDFMKDSIKKKQVNKILLLYQISFQTGGWVIY
jgi:hypothetical protein